MNLVIRRGASNVLEMGLERVRSAGPVSPCPGLARRDRIFGNPPEASVKNLLVQRGPLTFSETGNHPGRRG